MSSRRLILLNIISALENISIANGYNTDVRYVSENLAVPSELSVSKFPALFAIDADEIFEGKNQITSKLEIIINGYIKYSGDKNEKLDNLIDDVTKAVLSDRKRGCLANDTNILSITTDKGTDKKFGYFEMRFSVTYLHPDNFFQTN